MPDLMNQARDVGVKDQVLFKGFVSEDEKFQHLWRSDLFCYTSQHEGVGIVFLEAMGCELPVVCYDNGGQTDFIQDRINGRLLPLNDLDAFVEACRTLQRDRPLRLQMARAARETARKYYIDAYAEAHQRLFNEATGSASTGVAGIGAR